MTLKNSKFLIALMIFIMGAGAAFAASISGKPMTAVDDVVAATGVNPALKKDSLLYVTHDKSSGKVEFKYARFGDDYKLDTADKTLLSKNTSIKEFKISGLYPAVSKNYTTSTVPPAVVMTEHLPKNGDEYKLNLFQLAKTNNTVSMTEKSSVKSGNKQVSYSDDKDISALKGGIFASGSTREIFAALQWNELHSTAILNLDLFSVAQGGAEMKWEKAMVIANGGGYGSRVAKMAVGDFNGDGYANEIAVLTNIPDQWKFYLNVYQVNWKGTVIDVTTLVNAKEVYSHAVDKSYNTQRDLWFLRAAGDIAMADFNGDGRQEIAVVYKGHNEDLPSGLDSALPNTVGPVYVKLYQYSATRNDKLVESKSVAKKSFTSYTKHKTDSALRVLTDIGDIKAVAADVDGDGKSELVMLGIERAANYNFNLIVYNTISLGEWTAKLHIWRHSAPSSNTNASDIPATLNMTYDRQIPNFSIDVYKSNKYAKVRSLNADIDSYIGGYRAYVTGRTFTEQALQIVSGVFSGTATEQKECQDIIVSCASYLDDVKARIDAICPVLDNNGKLKEFKVINIMKPQTTKNLSIGLAAGDFVGDGVLLKNPYHIYHEGRSIFTSIIQAQPYHVDYIPLPWETDGKPKLANFTYVPGGEVSYVRTKETQNKNTVSTTFNSTYEMKSKVGASISYSPTDFIPFIPDPNDKFSPKFSFLLEGRANYTGKDTSSKIEKVTDTVKTTETVKASAVDSVMAHSVRHHIWRYPIDPVPEWYKTRSKDISSDGKFAYTITMTEAPKSHKGRIGYNARHEEGNLFSYPTKIENIPDFVNAKTKILTEPVDYLLEAGEYSKEVNVTMSKEKENSVTAEYKWEVGVNAQFMYGNYGIGKSGVKVDTDHQWSWNGIRNNVLNSTFTKGDKLTVKFADPSNAGSMSGLINNVAFATTYQAYINPEGLMKMGFAVNLQGGGSPIPMLWRDSVYNKVTDPAFVLPDKFAIKNKTVAVNPDKLSATTVRGVELYAMYEGRQIRLNAPYFAKGSTYVLNFPIYNASFVDAPAFTVRLSYAHYKNRNDTSKFTKIADVTVNNLKGWTQNSEANKTYASFTFKVPDNAEFGDYVFWAEIDPDNAVKEVHEAWDAKIPGGNNTGIFIFPIMDANGNSSSYKPGARVNTSDVKTTIKVGSSASKSAKKAAKSSKMQTAADGDNFMEYTPIEWTEFNSGRKLYDYIMSQDEPVEIMVNLDYISKTEPGLTLFEIIQEFEENGETWEEVYDEDTYYIIPDSDNTIDYDFYFIISSEDIKNGRHIRLDITDLDVLSGDEDEYTVSIPLIAAPSGYYDSVDPIKAKISADVARAALGVDDNTPVFVLSYSSSDVWTGEQNSAEKFASKVSAGITPVAAFPTLKASQTGVYIFAVSNFDLTRNGLNAGDKFSLYNVSTLNPGALTAADLKAAETENGTYQFFNSSNSAETDEVPDDGGNVDIAVYLEQGSHVLLVTSGSDGTNGSSSSSSNSISSKSSSSSGCDTGTSALSLALLVLIAVCLSLRLKNVNLKHY